jgi:beta-N-acetylhexosaminidase
MDYDIVLDRLILSHLLSGAMKKNLLLFSLLFLPLWAGLSLKEKLGQLILVPACPNRLDEPHLEDLKTAIEQWHIGGFIMKGGTKEQTKTLVEKLQGMATLKLLIVADAEWGAAMRVTDAPLYPKNMTLGALGDVSLIEEMGREVGKELKSLGIHINLAPVADVNTNPKNPIIHMRSFGDDPSEVAKRGMAMAKGLQSEGVFATAKHYPGHGDTYVDSHVALPITTNYELIPFKALIDQNVGCVMTAHLFIPSVDKVPVTLSKKWVTQIMKEELGFSGLTITDGLNMKGIAQIASSEEIAIRAFLAGHDLLLYGDHVNPNVDEILRTTIPSVLFALENAVATGIIREEEIDSRVEKILAFKENLETKTTAFPAATLLPSRLYQDALTALGQIPKLNQVHVTELGKDRNFAAMLEKEGVGKGGDTILVCGEQEKPILQSAIEQTNPRAIVLFGSPYLLSLIPEEIPVLLAYEEAPDAYVAAAKALAGKIPCKGHLPVKISRPHQGGGVAGK